MADVNANIGVHIDTSAALAELKNLQRQLATFHSSVAKSSAASAAAQKNLQTNLLNSINATGKFSAQMGNVRTSTESFTHALETNKLSMREYFRYAGGSTRTFGKLFKQEFDTIGKVAQERVKTMQTQYIKMGRDASGAMKAMSIRPNTLNMNDYATKTALAAQKQALLNQLLKQGSTNLLNFGKNTQWAGRQLMVGFTVPLAYFGSMAAKTFMDLEKQAIRFKRVYGDIFTTADETNKALADIQKLAEEFTKYGVAIVDTIEMAADAAAMGKTGAELTAQVAQATRLAVLGGVEQAQALETTISVTNAFGVATEDLASKINFLNAVENQTVVSIEDLTIAIPKAGPVVQQLGGDVEDLAFFLTAMKEGGINASEGANALKSGLAALINPTEKASEMLAGFGVNINAIVEGNQGNIRETVIDFAQALDTLDPLNRARAIEQLFGKFQFSRLSTLFQNVTKDGTQASRVLDLAGASIEELAILSERELAVLEDAIGTDFKESIEKLKLAIAPIGKEFLKAITPVAKTIGEFLEKFNNLGDGTKKFIVIATTLVGVIGPVLLMTFGLLANGVANIIKLFITMRSGFLKAGSNSNILAQQTSYLNTEQLEAASVAASLNQAHTKLTQSFTIETSAIKLLRQAYIEATVAAANFARANPGMMMPGRGGKAPKKFARGTTYVPGKGNKDNVPAVLMPGEAVIPTDIAQDPRFQPIIDAMVNGNLQGFENGTVFAHAVNNRVISGSSVPANIQGAGFKSANAYSAIGFDVLKETNSRLNVNKMLIDDYRREISNPMATQTMVGRLMAPPNNVSARDAYKVTEKIRANLLASLEKIPSGTFIGDKDVYSRMGNARTGILGGIIQKSRGGSFGSAVSKLLAPTAFSPRGKPTAVMNGVAPIQNVIDAVKKTKTNQSALRALVNLQKADPSLRIPVKIDSAGNITGYQRPELSKKTGKPTTTMNAAVLDGDRFRPGRVDRGGGRQIRISPKTRAMAAQVIMGKGEILNTTDNRSTVVTGQTGTAKKPGTAMVGGGPGDRRAVPASKVKSVIPRGYRGAPMFGFGAETGYNANQMPPSNLMQPSIAMSKIEKDFKAQQNSLRRQIELVEKRRLKALKEELKIIEDKNKTAKQSAPLTKKQLNEQKREVRAQRAQKIGRVAGPVAGIAGMASMAGFMTGNAGAGMAAMGVSALASIAPMLANPLGATAVALTAVVGSIVLLRKEFDKAQNEAMQMAEAMGSGEKAINGLAKFANEVSAGEIMNRRRGNLLTPFSVQTGKTTFGDNFVKGEDGKAMMSNISETIKTSGSKAAQDQVLSQFSTAVASGALSAGQARNIIASLGKELGDYSFAISVNSKLTELVGVNGENLLKDPLTIRVKLMEESRENLVKQSKLTNQMGSGALTQTQGRVAIGATVAGGAATGALIGSAVPVVGTAIGAAVGAIVAGGAAYFAQKGSQEKLGRASGANIAMQKMALEQSQQMQDSLNLEYEKRIQSAKEAGNTAEAIRLQGEYQIANNKLVGENAKLVTDIETSYKNSSGAVRGALETGLDKQITARFKDTAMADIAPLAGDLIEDSQLSKESQFTIKMQLASGQMDPMQIVKLMETFGQDKQALTKVMNIITKFGGTMANDVTSITSLFVDKNGKPIKDLQTKFIAKVESAGNVEEAEKIRDFYAQVSKTGEVLETSVQVDFLMKNPLIALELMKTFSDINNLKGKINFEVAAKILNAEQVSALTEDIDTFNAIKTDDLKKVYLQTLVQTMATVSPNDPALKTWLTTDAGTAYKNSPPGTQLREYAQWNANQLVALGVANVIPGSNIKPPSDTKTRDTTLDETLKKLKFLRDASIDTTKGIKELQRVMTKSGGDIKIFKGVSQQLRAKGMNQAFIDFLFGLDKDIQKKFITIKNGIVTITKDGKNLAKALNEIEIGSFTEGNEEAIQGLKAQSAKFKELTSSGISAKEALSLVTNEQVALALASGKTEEEIDKMIRSLRRLRNQEEQTLKAINPEEFFKKQMNMAMEYYDVLEQEQKNIYQPQIDAINKLIEANDELIENQQRNLEMNFDRPIEKYNQDLAIIDKAAQGINDKYDAQEKALEKISSINEEISQQEKGRLTLADALSQGDIAAAARAAQEMRAEAAQSAIEKNSEALQAARETEILGLTVGGLTRTQIEEKIYQIEQDRLPILTSIRNMEDQNYNYRKKSIEPLQKALDKELEAIETQRKKWTDTQLAIDGAKVRTKEYSDALEYGESILKKIKDLWDGIQSKTVTLTTVQQTLGGGVSGGSSRAEEIKKATEEGIALMTEAEMVRAMNTGYLSLGGLVPKYFAKGGLSRGTDTVPAMLTPGEFVMRKSAVDKFGPMLSAMNSPSFKMSNLGSYDKVSSGMNSVVDNSSAMYNYNIGITVPQSNANPNDIANAVIGQIKYIDAQRIRGQR